MRSYPENTVVKEFDLEGALKVWRNKIPNTIERLAAYWKMYYECKSSMVRYHERMCDYTNYTIPALLKMIVADEEYLKGKSDN